MRDDETDELTTESALALLDERLRQLRAMVAQHRALSRLDLNAAERLANVLTSTRAQIELRAAVARELRQEKGRLSARESAMLRELVANIDEARTLILSDAERLVNAAGGSA